VTSSLPSLNGCLPEAQELPNLSAVVFQSSGPTRRSVSTVSGYVDLVGYMVDDNTGYVVLLSWTAPFEHERFEQDGEADTRCAGLVGEQLDCFRG
jgi:hypothetical protein